MSTKISRGTRLASMVIDHIVMTIIAMIFSIPLMMKMPSSTTDLTTPLEPSLFDEYFFVFGLAVYLCKDCINGRSIAKRLLDLQVVVAKSKEIATPFKCLIRGIFCILWPIESIIALINPSQRLGDKIAGTMLVGYDRTRPQPKTNFKQVGMSLAIAYAFLIVILFPVILSTH